MTTTSRTMTIDEAAAHILVHGTKADMQRLRKEAAIASGDMCPECGSTDIESNGARRHEDLEFRCCDHDHRWMAAECTITLPR